MIYTDWKMERDPETGRLMSKLNLSVTSKVFISIETLCSYLELCEIPREPGFADGSTPRINPHMCLLTSDPREGSFVVSWELAGNMHKNLGPQNLNWILIKYNKRCLVFTSRFEEH